MNNLVAYGDDSDEESPRRRSFDKLQQDEGKSPSPISRRRKNSDMYFDDTNEQSSSPESDKSDTFAEPPPPKRATNDYSPTPSHRTPIGMTTVASVSSLVSYGGDAGDQEEEDNFDKAEMEVTEGNSPSAEPAPPPRISQDEEIEDEDEHLIDQALQESFNGIKEKHIDEISTGSATPMQTDSPHTPIIADTIEQNSEELEMPPSPPGESDPMIQSRIEAFFQKKDLGYNFNQTLQNMRSFLNPSCYEKFIEDYQLEEKGSNFKKEIFDPFCFPENCYYDSIAEEQRKIMEKATADTIIATFALILFFCGQSRQTIKNHPKRSEISTIKKEADRKSDTKKPSKESTKDSKKEVSKTAETNTFSKNVINELKKNEKGKKPSQKSKKQKNEASAIVETPEQVKSKSKKTKQMKEMKPFDAPLKSKQFPVSVLSPSPSPTNVVAQSKISELKKDEAEKTADSMKSEPRKDAQSNESAGKKIKEDEKAVEVLAMATCIEDTEGEKLVEKKESLGTRLDKISPIKAEGGKKKLPEASEIVKEAGRNSSIKSQKSEAKKKKKKDKKWELKIGGQTLSGVRQESESSKKKKKPQEKSRKQTIEVPNKKVK